MHFSNKRLLCSAVLNNLNQNWESTFWKQSKKSLLVLYRNPYIPSNPFCLANLWLVWADTVVSLVLAYSFSCCWRSWIDPALLCSFSCTSGSSSSLTISITPFVPRIHGRLKNTSLFILQHPWNNTQRTLLHSYWFLLCLKHGATQNNFFSLSKDIPSYGMFCIGPIPVILDAVQWVTVYCIRNFKILLYG